MAFLEINGLRKRFGSVEILKGIRDEVRMTREHERRIGELEKKTG